MSDASAPQPEEAAIPEPAGRKGWKRWQTGLRSLILLIAMIAVWMTAHVNKEAIQKLEKRNQSMRPLAHLLKVDDYGQFAVVLLEPLWPNDLRWDLHVPPGNYRLCMATRDILDQGLTKPTTIAPIGSGKHRIGLEVEEIETGKRVNVFCDGSKLLTIDEPKDWGGLNWSSYAEFSASEQRPSEKPLAFYRRRYSQDHDNQLLARKNPTDGILLWIERSTGPDQAPH
jgi:hypothetical protein